MQGGMVMVRSRVIAAIGALLIASAAQAAWVSTGYTDFDIRMDNGRTYFYGVPMAFSLSGNCLYNRLELNDTGDRFSSVENAKRMMSLILSAKMSGRKVFFGYDDADGPTCRVAQIYVQW